MPVALHTFDNKWFKPGFWPKRLVWYICNVCFFRSGLFPFYRLKTFLLRLFGAKIGKAVLIKPCVNIKYPWFLEIGDNSWIGENAWIDNLSKVTVGANVCISQGAYLLTGNHNYSKPGFDLIVKGIILEDGVWIGARSVICPGVTCKSHAILSAGAVATKDLDAYSIYQGNPAVKIRDRIIKE